MEVEGGAIGAGAKLSGSNRMVSGVEDERDQSAQVETNDESHAPAIARRPYTPSKAEVEAHYPLHLEFRSWCPHCRAGKGISMQHRYNSEVDESHLGTTWSMDYCFMSPEDIEEDMHAILICYDHSKMGMWAIAVDRKGADENIVKWVVDKMDECGYSGVTVTLKSDQEPAMMSLKKAIAVRRKAETPLIESPVRESKSNGKIERAIRKWQGQFRTLRHHLEARIGTKISNDSVIVEWLIVWVADIFFEVHDPSERESIL